ncbi:YceI family protein [Maribacter polysiphoniae]|uniref:Polyisoprenoid-binding protein YceI n=1 Tax=Maribacter polysiphoniae TaxID=429344 RepID=A0A316E5R0_9FLAO|nr:YceI family protein [Maribacter polysiphoniae]MBD1262338.1 YceI family protein [Maribacter polysiphoniae]PWK26037.1 polyisoprenoid-binding protein YceI [Maribacter polysiphoniae]
MRNTILLFLVFMQSLVAVAQENYTLTDKGGITVDGSSTLHDWTVTANAYSGALALNDKVFTSISLEVDVISILSTRGATMDKKTHNALKFEAFPKIKFEAKDVAFSEGDGQAIPGTLHIAGVGKEVVIQTRIQTLEGGIQISGSYTITLQDFNIEPPTAMFGSIVVGDDVTVNFDLVFAK